MRISAETLTTYALLLDTSFLLGLDLLHGEVDSKNMFPSHCCQDRQVLIAGDTDLGCIGEPWSTSPTFVLQIVTPRVEDERFRLIQVV
jgi:hypothetical protein